MESVFREIRQHLPVSDESRRLFHGRGHCFPGYEDLLIDWFRPVVLLSLYAQRDDAWLTSLASMLQHEVTGVEAVLLQERFLADGPVRLLWGTQPAEIDAVEKGLRFRLRVGEAQNLGFFPDMQRGRQLVRTLSAGRKVLNLFSYSCSFSVAALSAGAAQVVNVDMNRGALDLGRLNHQLNKLDMRSVSFLPHEIFRSFSQLRKLGPFDLVICDPPAYQGKSFKAERDWPKLLRKISVLLTPGADLLACLNGPHLPPDFLTDLFRQICPELHLLDSFQPGPDFPENEAARGVWVFHYRHNGGRKT